MTISTLITTDILLSVIGHIGVPGGGGGEVGDVSVLGVVLIGRHGAPGDVLG